MRILVRAAPPPEAFSVCGQRVEKLIERIGRHRLRSSRDASYCGENVRLIPNPGGFPDPKTELYPYCQCLLDFESEKIYRHLSEKGLPNAFQSSGSVYWEAIGRAPSRVTDYLDADIPVLDEFAAKEILGSLEKKTFGNCQYTGTHDVRHHPAAHIHFSCQENSESLLDSVGDTISAMLSV